MMDAIQLILLVLLILLLLFGMKRLRPTAEYISNSLKKSIFWIFCHMVIIFIFAVIGTILYGDSFSDARDIYRSTTIMLLLSVGKIDYNYINHSYNSLLRTRQT